MIQSYYTQSYDRVGWFALSWRIYLMCIAVSFFVMIEPAPTDLIFFIALGAFMLAPLRPVKLLGPVASGGLLLYLWFTFFSLAFVAVSVPVAARAVFIEVYLVLLFLMTAYFVKLYGDRAFRMILLMLTLGAMITSVIGLLAYLDLIPNRVMFFRDEHMSRIKSTFKDPNVLGPYLVPPILFTMWMAFSVRRLRWCATAAFGVLAACLLVTFSRGAWVHIALTGMIFFGLLLVDRRSTIPAVTFLLIAIACGAIKVGFFSEATSGALSDNFLASRLSFQSYDTGRFEHIFKSLGDMFDKPWGIGANQARLVYGFEPHNTFVVLGLQNGVFAAIGFTVLYFAAGYRCLKKVIEQRDGWMKYAFVLAIMVGLFVLMNVVGSLHWRHLYVVLGLAFGSYYSNSIFQPKA